MEWTKKRLAAVLLIESSLMNDESSTDDELSEFFIGLGFEPATVALIMKQRNTALNDMHFDLNADGMNLDTYKGE